MIGAGRDSDLVFRYGGDEFTFLLPHTDEAGALQVAERARQAVVSVDLTVSASIGVATFPVDGPTASEVLLAADRACFVAKRDGRDRIATAAEGLALAAEFSLQAPTPVDSASTSTTVADRHRDAASSRHCGRHAQPIRRSRRHPRPGVLVSRVRAGARQPEPVERRRRAATPTVRPTPAGPTPTPSFVRPTPTPQPTFFVYTGRDVATR